MKSSWKIKALVVKVEEERQFKSGEGTLRSVILKDDSQVEIRATLLNGLGDQNGNFLQLGREYVFQNGII